MINEEYSDQINELWSLFKEAEDEIAKISHLADGLDCTPLNQLRYAGRHLVNALNSKSSDTPLEEIKLSMRHCQRAIYDAKDTGIIFYLAKINAFKIDYRGVEITPHVPNYSDIIKSARVAKKMVDDIRSNHDSRYEFYKKAKETCDSLESHCETLEDAREELNKALKSNNRNLTFAWIGLGVGLISIIGVIITVLTFMNSPKP